MEIRFVAQEDIDRLKWDSCVHYANNGNVFGYSWFLNNTGKTWDGLVEGDYESVFPLVWREDWLKKKELFQPILVRELGLYSVHVLSPSRIGKFLKAIPDEYRHIDITLNEQNLFKTAADFEHIEHSNYQMLITAPYEEIKKSFSPELIANLEKAEENDLYPSGSMKPEKLADFYQKYSKDVGAVKTQKFHALQRIMYNALHRGTGFITGVANRDGELLAASFFINGHGKLLRLIAVESPEGAAQHAMDMLINLMIQSNAGRPLLLDFNSDDSHLEAFGAIRNPYYSIKRNKRFLGVI